MSYKFCYCMRSRKERRILERGVDYTLKELQIDHFIKMRNQISVVLKTLFTKLERYLLRNNQVFVLNTSTDEENSDSDD